MKLTRPPAGCGRPSKNPAPQSLSKARSATTPEAARYYLIGLSGGLLGGLLGIGGGSIIAPLLLVTAALRPAQVSGTTLATVLLISLVGSGAYASLGHMDLGLAWPIALGSVTGAIVGALGSRALSARLMLGIFLLILPYFALKELWPSLAAPALSTGGAWSPWSSWDWARAS